MLFRVVVGVLHLTLIPAVGIEQQTPEYRVPLTVTSDLPLPHVPMDPSIDFDALIRDAKLPGVLNPNSITVFNPATGKAVPHAVTEDFTYGNRGRVEWVVENPAHRKWEIRFRTSATRPPLLPAMYTPMIGLGDLLRYNAGQPRPIALCYPSGMVDLTGDGKPDLVGCWNYAYRPGWPWDGIICYPRVGNPDALEFGDLIRIRYLENAEAKELKHFSRIYMHAAFADLNRDGRFDLVYSPSGGDTIHLYLNSGRRDPGGMPVFVASGTLSRQTSAWEPIRAVDLNKDGAIDLVVGSTYLKNTTPEGWPLKPAKAVTLDAGNHPSFFDVDGDGALDSVCLIGGPTEHPNGYRVAWRRNQGGDPPVFGPAEPRTDIAASWCSRLAAVTDGPQRGVLVEHDAGQRISLYAHGTHPDGKAVFTLVGPACSDSAVMSLSDQAWPCACDWDADGDWDLLVGGGYGWPRIVINNGSNRRPAFSKAQPILADGKPIRVLRDEVLGSKHWHNMGYPYPVYVDWDADGLPDLMLPNETNRIFWHKNIGTRQTPKFGPRQQVICEGYPETPEKLAESARLAGDEKTPNSPYPYEKDQPFFWRTGAAFADWNGDGITDFVTHDGFTRKATLFVQVRHADGTLRSKKDRQMKLADGRLIDDSLVGRTSHWTESFRAADWDGDGLTDLIYALAGSSGDSIYRLRNCGTKSDPVFENPVPLRCFGSPIHVTAHGPSPWVGDMDGDGKPDVLACVEWSVYPFYSHTAIEMPQRPTFELSPAQPCDR